MTRLLAVFARLGAAAAPLALASPGLAQGPVPSSVPLLEAPGGGPVLGRLRIFDDWAVGCDNQLSCEAVALVPEGAGQSYMALVVLQRAGGGAGAGTIRLLGAEQLRGQIELMVDNRRLARIKAEHDMVEITGPAALETMRALASNYAFELRAGKKLIDAPSLSGLPAALRYMDEVQGRVGSVAALVATGEEPAERARPVPAAPVMAAFVAVGADASPPVFTPQEQAAARRLAVCDGLHDSDYPPEIHRLDTDHALLLLPCQAGEYNVSAVPLIATATTATAAGAGGWTFRIARFDHVPGASGDPDAPPLIVNARWNPSRAELSSFAKGRALGDCGAAETYKWDGSRFRLVEARSMPVCRGAWEWPVLYSAGTAGE
ncbi:MAG TPA: DUF1176 domain-containing protein [Sphingobium sp.]|nr:DUF1176 domain-containing protein [Sphingobium sp.]